MKHTTKTAPASSTCTEMPSKPMRRFSNLRSISIALALAAPPLSACDGGDEATAPRRVAANDTTQTKGPSTKVTAPARMHPNQPPNVIQAPTTNVSVATVELADLSALRAAAETLEAQRPEFYARIWSLAPGKARNGMPRFVGTEHHDPDAALVFAMRLLDGNAPAGERTALANVLARTGGDHGRLDTLLLAAEADAPVRALLVHNLGKLSPELATEGLVAGLNDTDVEVRNSALEAATHQPSANADLQAALIPLLDDSDASVQLAAVRSLGVLKVEAALGPIAARVAAGDSQMRVEALRAVSRIDPGYLAQLDLAGLSSNADASVAAEAQRLLRNPTR